MMCKIGNPLQGGNGAVAAICSFGYINKIGSSGGLGMGNLIHAEGENVGQLHEADTHVR
jgi:hypothetical protein